jgi:DNA repair exonuclease SbcCD ATPase subunit
MALNAAKTELASLEKRIVEVETRRSELGPMETVASTETLAGETADLEAEVTQLNAAYQPASNEYTRMTGELGAMQTSLNLARDTAIKRTSLESRLGTAKALSKYLRGNRDRFMGQVWDGIMGQASSFSSACTGGAIEGVSRGENGRFSFFEGGHELPVEAASGAQRSIMGLGVQLAMASLLPCPLTTIMLDEPGSDMDPERALSLTTLLAADHNQLLMVSHRELDGAVANNTIALERT